MSIIETVYYNYKKFFVKSDALPVEIFIFVFLVQKSILKSNYTIIQLVLFSLLI